MFLTSWLRSTRPVRPNNRTMLQLERLDQRDLPSAAAGIFAVGADVGGAPEVHVYNADGSLRNDILAYSPDFTGGVRVAVADVNGDGVPDIITAAGPGGGPQIEVFDGVTGQLDLSFFAYNPSFSAGVSVAAGEINGKGVIVTGTGFGAEPRVNIFDGNTGALEQSYDAYDPGFLGGVNVGVGDVMGNGIGSVVTGAGFGGGPHVKVFDGLTGNLQQQFFAYDAGFTGGVSIAVGDVTGLGRAEIITGAGPTGGPHVKVFDAETATTVQSFFAYDATFTGGVTVAVAASDGGTTDIVTGAGPGGGPHLKVFDGKTGTEIQSFFAFPASFSGGLALGTGYGRLPAAVAASVPGDYDVPPPDNTYIPGNGDNSGGYTDPGNTYTDPGSGNTDPGNTYTDPGSGDTDPGTTYTDPGDGYTDPGDGYTDPGDGYTDPGDCGC